MRSRALLCSLMLATFVAAFILQPGVDPQASAHHSWVRGKVTDAVTGLPIAGVCVDVGVPGPTFCWTTTNASGDYQVDFRPLLTPDGQPYNLFFQKAGYNFVQRDVTPDGETVVNVAMTPNASASPPPSKIPLNPSPSPSASPSPSPTPDACPTPRTGTPTQTVYLPNITKTLGGPNGFQTPFIVQNSGTASTDLEIAFNAFVGGACVKRFTVAGKAPGTAYAHDPNSDPGLPANSQFSVVIRSFGSSIVSVVNQHQSIGTGKDEAMSYVGVSAGSTSVFLPNITRNFFGFVTPFIIQNLGTQATNATASFVNRDTGATYTAQRFIGVGQSQFVDPNSETGLADGAYAVTVTSAQPVAVVVNTHQIGVPQPISYSANGITSGGPTVYGPYAAKNANNVQRVSTIVVQNMGTTPVTPSLSFTPLQGLSGTPATFTSPTPVAPGASWAFDPRFDLGTTTPCSAPSATCLADGEYSFVANAPGGTIAAVVNVISLSTPPTAMGYSATPTPSTTFFLPNVTRTLCFCPTRGADVGWSTPILLQAATATGATVEWYPFGGSTPVFTQNVTIAAGSGVKIDPRDVPQLQDDKQYSVVIRGSAGTIAAIVLEFASGGDNAMIYEGFPTSP